MRPSAGERDESRVTGRRVAVFPKLDRARAVPAAPPLPLRVAGGIR